MTRISLPSFIMLLALSSPVTGLASGGYFYITEGAEDYEKGKKLFYTKVICDDCPYPNLELTAEEVSGIMPALDHNGMIGKHLTLDDRKALKVYLNRRFNI